MQSEEQLKNQKLRDLLNFKASTTGVTMKETPEEKRARDLEAKIKFETVKVGLKKPTTSTHQLFKVPGEVTPKWFAVGAEVPEGASRVLSKDELGAEGKVELTKDISRAKNHIGEMGLDDPSVKGSIDLVNTFEDSPELLIQYTKTFGGETFGGLFGAEPEVVGGIIKLPEGTTTSNYNADELERIKRNAIINQLQQERPKAEIAYIKNADTGVTGYHDVLTGELLAE